MVTNPSHRDMILDQFSRQAVPFSTAPGIKDEQALRLIVELSGAGPEDTVLDVACGGGIIVCAFARVVRHATGIDLTPAMIERARALQAEQGLANVSWKLRDPSHVRAMPLTELRDLFRQAGLPAPRGTNYRLEGELEGLLGRSFPLPGDADRIRETFAASLGDDRLGIPMAREGERIRYAYPVAVLVADR